MVKQFQDETNQQLVDQVVEPFIFWSELNGMPEYVLDGIRDARDHAYHHITEEDQDDILLRLRNVLNAHRTFGEMHLKKNNQPDLLDVGMDISEELKQSAKKADFVLFLKRKGFAAQWKFRDFLWQRNVVNSDLDKQMQGMNLANGDEKQKANVAPEAVKEQETDGAEEATDSEDESDEGSTDDSEWWTDDSEESTTEDEEQC